MTTAEWNAKVNAGWSAIVARHAPHPAYPSNSQLRTERLASSLLAEQQESTVAFKRALAAFAAAFDALHFPLGSPVTGYDVQDINGTIADWMIPNCDFEDAANDAAREQEEAA